MPELPPFPDLATPAAAETTPPSFERLAARAGARRRRRSLLAVASGVVAVAIVASGIAVTRSHHDSDPIPPATPPSSGASSSASGSHLHWSEMTPAQRLSWTRDGFVSDLAVDEQGDTLVVWSRDDTTTGSTHSAWELMSMPSGKHYSALVPGQFSGVIAADGGFVISPTDSAPHPLFVGADGTTEPFTRVPPQAAGSSDIELGDGTGLSIADPATRTWWPTKARRMVEPGTITGNGHVWFWEFGTDPATSSGKPTLISLCDSGICPKVVFPAGATIPGQIPVSYGNRIAAFASVDGATITPVRGWAVSQDGTHFQVFPPSQVPFPDVANMASTSTGKLVVSSADGRVWVSTDDTWLHFARLDVGHRVSLLKPGVHGDVMATIDTRAQPSLLMIDKDTLRAGSWTEPSDWRH